MANYRTKIILDNSSHIIFNNLIKPNCLTNNHIYLGYTNTNQKVVHYSNNYFYEKLPDSTSNYYIYNASLRDNSCIPKDVFCDNTDLFCCEGLICNSGGIGRAFCKQIPKPTPCGKKNQACCSGNICDSSSLMCRQKTAGGGGGGKNIACISISGTTYLRKDDSRNCAKFNEIYCGAGSNPITELPNYICTNYCIDPYYCKQKDKTQCDSNLINFEIPEDISINYDCTGTRKYCPASPCGNINQKCCSGNKCNDSFICNTYNICISNTGYFITDTDLSTCKQYAEYAENICHLYPKSKLNDISINNILCNNKYCSIDAINNDIPVPYYTSINYDCTYTMNNCPTPAPTPKHGYITFSSSGDMNSCYLISERKCEPGACPSPSQCPFICDASSICDNLYNGEKVYYDCGGGSWCPPSI